MPCDYKNYPDDWHEISRRLRLERAGGRCECFGECGVDHQGRCLAENGMIRARLFDGGSVYVAQDENIPAPHDMIASSKVVLTVAHLWQSACAEHHEAKVKCGDEDHLKAMCQACHLLYDLPHHMESARQTRQRKKDDQRTLLEPVPQD